MADSRKEAIRALHRKGPWTQIEAVALIVLFFGLAAGSVLLFDAGYWPLSILIMLVQAHIGHSNLLAFHEAAHYTLHRNRWINETKGILVGSLILTPLSVFRFVHNQHHLYLGSEKDLENWPYVIPGTSVWLRRATSAGELLVGFFFTPIVFLHGVLTATHMTKPVARRIALEYLICVCMWAALLSVVAYFQLWRIFLIGWLVPVVIAGNLQSLRKFTEHMGMMGDTTESMTRTVIDESWFGRSLAFSMLNIQYHGIHHEFAKIPQYNLPAATPLVYTPEQIARTFPTYWSAMWDMFPHLIDPRMGPQWNMAPVKREAPHCESPSDRAPALQEA